MHAQARSGFQSPISGRSGPLRIDSWRCPTAARWKALLRFRCLNFVGSFFRSWFYWKFVTYLVQDEEDRIANFFLSISVVCLWHHLKNQIKKDAIKMKHAPRIHKIFFAAAWRLTRQAQGQAARLLTVGGNERRPCMQTAICVEFETDEIGPQLPRCKKNHVKAKRKSRTDGENSGTEAKD